MRTAQIGIGPQQWSNSQPITKKKKKAQALIISEVNGLDKFFRPKPSFFFLIKSRRRNPKQTGFKNYISLSRAIQNSHQILLYYMSKAIKRR